MTETTDQRSYPIEARLACADSAFPKLSHELALAVIRDLGIGAADVCVFAGYEHTPPEAVAADPLREADRVRAGLDRHELAVADVFAILSDPFEELAVNHPDSEVRGESLRRFERLLDFARRVGAPGLTVLPGMPFDDVERERGIATAAAELQRRAELAAEVGLALSFEPHVGSIANTPAETLTLLEQAPDVSLALDHTHFVYQGIPQGDVDPLLPRARHMHLRQAAPGVIQAPAREGTIDFGQLLVRLADVGYAGYLTLEYQWEEALDFNRVDCIGETAELRDLLLATGV